jgi:hypothetical protein
LGNQARFRGWETRRVSGVGKLGGFRGWKQRRFQGVGKPGGFKLWVYWILLVQVQPPYRGEREELLGGSVGERDARQDQLQLVIQKICTQAKEGRRSKRRKEEREFSRLVGVWGSTQFRCARRMNTHTHTDENERGMAEVCMCVCHAVVQMRKKDVHTRRE